MMLKPKSWLWKLTWPFAHNNWTTIGNTVYCPPNRKASKGVLQHEIIHIQQQAEVGLLKFLFLYLFCLPFFHNPWRYKWEHEAYALGNGLSNRQIEKILGSRQYGWLRRPKD